MQVQQCQAINCRCREYYLMCGLQIAVHYVRQQVNKTNTKAKCYLCYEVHVLFVRD